MHTDARELPNNTHIKGDICIVGTGPAGLSIAMEWNHTPYKVILLEGGGFEYDDQMQDTYAGPETGQRYYPLKSTRLHYFGGTSNHWAGFCSTFDALDFEKKDWVPHSGWPIKKTDLDPYYAKAQEVLDLGPYEYDVKYWQGKDPALKSLLPEDNPVVWNKVWQFSPPTRFARKYGDAVKRSGNIHLYTYAHVTEINANESVKSIEHLTVRNFAGKTHTVKAKYFILACNTVQNARLLLAACPQAPKGLGNDNDLVGRFFMEHLEVQSAWLHLPQPAPLKLYLFGGIGGTRMRCEMAIRPEWQARYRMLNGTCSFAPWELAKGMTPPIKMWSSEDPRKNEDSMRSMWHSHEGAGKAEGYNVFELKTRIEQAPNPDSRITLSTDRDGLGMLRAQLHWVLTPFEKYSMRTLYELIGQQVGMTAVGRIQLMDYLRDPNDHSWPDTTGGGWHHMGTTRMSDNPNTGVVDSNNKLHGVANLFIAGASCFVTAAAPNPTLTITALSLRLSAYLKTLIIK